MNTIAMLGVEVNAVMRCNLARVGCSHASHCADW